MVNPGASKLNHLNEIHQWSKYQTQRNKYLKQFGENKVKRFFNWYLSLITQYPFETIMTTFVSIILSCFSILIINFTIHVVLNG